MHDLCVLNSMACLQLATCEQQMVFLSFPYNIVHLNTVLVTLSHDSTVVLNTMLAMKLNQSYHCKKPFEVPNMWVVVVCLPVLMTLVDLTHLKRQFSFSNNDHPEKSHLSLDLHHCCLPKTLSEAFLFRINCLSISMLISLDFSANLDFC